MVNRSYSSKIYPNNINTTSLITKYLQAFGPKDLVCNISFILFNNYYISKINILWEEKRKKMITNLFMKTMISL